MKYGKTLPPLGIAIIVSLLMVAIPARPVLAAPTITLSPASGAIGTRVTITGMNFHSYTGDSLFIFFNEVEIADSPGPIPPTGDFTAAFDIPSTAVAGTAWVTVKGPLGSVLAESSFFVPTTIIGLDVEEGTVGTVVTATGEGFCSDKMVAFYYYFSGIREKLGTERASLIGECSYQFTVPVSTGGTQRIIAEGAEGNSAEAQFNVLPSANINPSSAAAGETVTISGTGFSQSGQITIYLSTTTVALALTDEHGSFAAAFNVPVIKARPYIVKIQDRYAYLDWMEFTITAGAKLNKDTGNIGTELIVSGTGFISERTVTIKYDTLEVDTATADLAGVFATAFDVPVSASGSHLITVSDGTNTRQLVFIMESEAPPAPTLLPPQMDIEAESPVYFHWQEVDDLSLPISYGLQIASDEDFISIVLEKQGLSHPEYTLTEEEKLEPARKDVTYYWRVKAVDGASNESQWSSPESFYISSGFTLPVWVIAILIAVGVLVVGFLVYRVWYRRRYLY